MPINLGFRHATNGKGHTAPLHLHNGSGEGLPSPQTWLAAKAVHDAPQDVRNQYLVWTRVAWQGDVARALKELRVWQAKLSAPDEDIPHWDPRKVLATTINYLESE
jgi:hypothetical protein